MNDNIFRQIRFQTGEQEDVVKLMKAGEIPCVDVYDDEEMEWFAEQLKKYGVYKVEGIPYDTHARDRVSEPEFEYRVAFCSKPVNHPEAEKEKLMYIDFYFEPDPEDTYDPVGEM